MGDTLSSGPSSHGLVTTNTEGAGGVGTDRDLSPLRIIENGVSRSEAGTSEVCLSTQSGSKAHS